MATCNLETTDTDKTGQDAVGISSLKTRIDDGESETSGDDRERGTSAVSGESKEGEQEPTQTMSKNQLKKLKKRQRWLEIKSAKRKDEKERRKQKRREARDKGEDLGPSRKKLKENKMATSSCDLRVVIDCSFDHIMAEKDVCKMVQQIQHSYSANRRADQPMQLYVTSVGGKCQDRLDALGDYNNWDLHFKTEGFEELFDKSSVVYLSSDSDNVLETLESDKVYVIGGLVDHNHFKGLCHNQAVEKGIAHAQLPIGSYLDMKTRKVLTVNQVVEILLRYTETHDWEEAFFAAIPKRKGAVVKTEGQQHKGKDPEQGSDPASEVSKSGLPSEVSTAEGVQEKDGGCDQSETVADAETACVSEANVSEVGHCENEPTEQCQDDGKGADSVDCEGSTEGVAKPGIGGNTDT